MDKTVIDILRKYNIYVSFKDIINRYSEPHRHYHTIEHVNFILNEINKLDLPKKDKEILIITAVFHDIKHIPGSKENEKRSADYLLNRSEYSEDIQTIYDIIIDTATHEPRTKLSEIFCDIDMMSVSDTTFSELVKSTNKVYKEYRNFFTHDEVRNGQIDFLTNILKTKYGKKNKENILKLIKYMENDMKFLESFGYFKYRK